MGARPAPGGQTTHSLQADTDPVCGMTVDPATAAAHRTHDDTEVFFCGSACANRFDANPAAFTFSTHPST
ncbi:MAG: hypothetical protein NVS3B12_20220 [Acidimicrobiales bacterium]